MNVKGFYVFNQGFTITFAVLSQSISMNIM